MATPQNFVIVLVEEFSHLAVPCAVAPLRIANPVSESTLYSWSCNSENGVAVTCLNGSTKRGHGGFQDIRKFDRLFVLSGITMLTLLSKPHLAMLLQRSLSADKTGALCSAAWIPAAAPRSAMASWQFRVSQAPSAVTVAIYCVGWVWLRRCCLR